MKSRIFTLAIVALLLVPQGVSAFSVAPSLVDLRADLGGTTSGEFMVQNTSEMKKTIYLDTNVFSDANEKGAPKFEKAEHSSEFASWISFEKSIYTIAANSQVNVPFTVNVPTTAPAGGYYAAITVSEAPSEIVSTNGAVIQAVVAILCFLTVEGDSIESLDIVSVESDISGFVSQLAGSTKVRMQNQGTIHLAPIGSVIVKDLFGREVQHIQLNSKEGRILPSSIREYEVLHGEIQNGYWREVKLQASNLAIGPMSLVVSTEYGSQAASDVEVISLFYLPWQLLSFVFFLVAILLALYRIAFHFQSKQ
jgi:hypothetical protein